MNKSEFLWALGEKLWGLPDKDIEERLNFYSEMIDDKMEEGLSEVEAVSQMGDIDALAAQIKADIPLAKLVKEKVKPKRKLGALEIALIILGSPIWLSILISAFAVIFSLYVSVWAVVVGLWSVFASFVGSAFASVVMAVGLFVGGQITSALVTLGTGFVLSGLSVFAFFGCKLATKGTVWLTKKAISGIKNLFVKKGGSTNE